MDYLQSNWCDKMMLKTKINILLSILSNYSNIFLFGTKLDSFYEFQLFNIISEGQTKYILIHCLTWFISSFYLRLLYKVGFASRISSKEIPSPSNCKNNTRSIQLWFGIYALMTMQSFYHRRWLTSVIGLIPVQSKCISVSPSVVELLQCINA